MAPILIGACLFLHKVEPIVVFYRNGDRAQERKGKKTFWL